VPWPSKGMESEVEFAGKLDIGQRPYSYRSGWMLQRRLRFHKSIHVMVSGMLIWSVIPVLVLSTLASGPFRESMPLFVEDIAQLAAVLSLFILVCCIEASGGGSGGKGNNSGSAS
jgi:hypothetical protein